MTPEVSGWCQLIGVNAEPMAAQILGGLTSLWFTPLPLGGVGVSMEHSLCGKSLQWFHGSPLGYERIPGERIILSSFSRIPAGIDSCWDLGKR